MINRFLKTLTLFLALIPCFTLAQSDSVKDLDKVTVFTKYRPVLSDAKRVEANPEMKDPEKKDLTFNYSFPDLRYKVQPGFTPISAQEYRNNTTTFLKNNFVKVGFGNYTTPLFHLELNNGKSKNYNYGLTAQHLSSSGEPKFKSFSDDRINLHGAKYKNGNTLSGQLGYSRFGFNYYGYNHEKDTFSKDSVMQAINNITGNIHFDNLKKTNRIKTEADLDVYRFSIREQHELGYRISNKTSSKVGNGNLSVITAFEGYASGPDSANYNRNFIDINPYYKMKYKGVDLTMGFFASVFLDSGLAKDGFYIYPDFRVDYYVVPEKMKAFAGLSGSLIKGSSRSLYNDNAFIAAYQNLKNQYTPYIIFGGIKGKLGSGFDYMLELSQQAIYNLPQYFSDTLSLQKFIIHYEDVSLFKFQASLNYNRFEKFKIGTQFSYYSYNTTSAHAFQRPNLEWNTNISGNIGKKLTLHAKTYVIGERYARYIWAVESEKLPVIADINVGAEYRHSKKLSFFVNANNLTNQTYQRWFNYPVYGLNAIGGATFVF